MDALSPDDADRRTVCIGKEVTLSKKVGGQCRKQKYGHHRERRIFDGRFAVATIIAKWQQRVITTGATFCMSFMQYIYIYCPTQRDGYCRMQNGYQLMTGMFSGLDDALWTTRHTQDSERKISRHHKAKNVMSTGAYIQKGRHAFKKRDGAIRIDLWSGLVCVLRS